MPAGIPTDTVLSMRNQGLSNNQIIQSLQRAAYSPQQIADAMAQADIKYNVESTPMGAQEAAASAAGSYGEAQAYPYEETAAPQTATATMAETGFSVEALQQLIEQIIEEKWEDLVKDVSRIADWKEKVDSRITIIEQQLSDMKASFDKLHTAILEKIGDYDRTIAGVGTDIKALENVFKKILPGFMENVGELSRITEDLRKRK
jgi:predicted  nucleic acid-binding Zn-ribbon protein